MFIASVAADTEFTIHLRTYMDRLAGNYAANDESIAIDHLLKKNVMPCSSTPPTTAPIAEATIVETAPIAVPIAEGDAETEALKNAETEAKAAAVAQAQGMHQAQAGAAAVAQATETVPESVSFCEPNIDEICKATYSEMINIASPESLQTTRFTKWFNQAGIPRGYGDYINYENYELEPLAQWLAVKNLAKKLGEEVVEGLKNALKKETGDCRGLQYSCETALENNLGALENFPSEKLCGVN